MALVRQPVLIRAFPRSLIAFGRVFRHLGYCPAFRVKGQYGPQATATESPEGLFYGTPLLNQTLRMFGLREPGGLHF